MTTQLSLPLSSTPIAGRARKRDPRSSVEAARTCGANAQRAQILRLLSASTEGLTADELAERMQPSPHRSSVAARLAQLADVKNGSQVYPFGIRHNDRNRPVQIWHLRSSSRPVESVATASRLWRLWRNGEECDEHRA